MLEENQFRQSFPDVCLTNVWSGLLGNVVQTDFTVALHNWFHKEVYMIPICRAVSHVGA